ncbi:MAG TPA: hypothetical protein VNI58_04070 [Mariprofundaceae bacterium]|nr:hypothetical protein [Mariprofundaceae bacterium]
MVLVVFALLSVPLGIFFSWFAWKAWKIRRMDVVKTMVALAAICFVTALLIAGWFLLLAER